MHHFFLDNQVLADEQAPSFVLRLTSADLRHARVLRLKPGEHIAVVDAASDYFECQVVSFDDDLRVRIASRADAPAPRPAVLLAQAVAKGEKMDTVVRHGTEIGVSAFVPFFCTRCVVRLDDRKAQARTARWAQIAKSAAMQSGQPAVPEVAAPVDVDGLCGMLSGATCVLVCWEQAQGMGVAQAVDECLARMQTTPEDARVAVVVGPEGGLEEGEVRKLLGCNRNARAVTLGPSILRTETAGIVASALAIHQLGGLQ